MVLQSPHHSEHLDLQFRNADHQALVTSGNSNSRRRMIDYATGVCRAMTSTVIWPSNMHKMSPILSCSESSASPGPAFGV